MHMLRAMAWVWGVPEVTEHATEHCRNSDDAVVTVACSTCFASVALAALSSEARTLCTLEVLHRTFLVHVVILAATSLWQRGNLKVVKRKGHIYSPPVRTTRVSSCIRWTVLCAVSLRLRLYHTGTCTGNDPFSHNGLIKC